MKIILFSLIIGLFVFIGSSNFQLGSNDNVFSNHNDLKIINLLACGEGGTDDDEDDKQKFTKNFHSAV